MIWLRRLLVVAMIGGVLAAGFLAGCTKSSGERVPNIPPETTLSFAPETGDTANYRVRMNWFGWDPDGEIAYFWTKWDTLDWVRVVNTDSVFLVSASADTVDEEKGYEYHTFAVKAVDNEGAEDDSPEEIAFTAFTIVPNTEIIRGPSGVTGPMVSFEWIGRDRDGVIVGYEYKLYRYEGDEWFEVTASGPLGPDETSVIFGPLAGRHMFEVWSLDDAGAPDLTPATRIFTCNPELAGPKLLIRSNVFGSFLFRGPVWADDYNLPIPIFAGERLEFSWAATGEDYGGEILGYRHAYDDTSTWPAWSVFDTRFEVAPDLGKHSLYVGALDNANVQTRARIYFDVIAASLDEYILVVDDYDWKEHQPSWGTDDDRTEFYDQLLAGYARDRVEWEPSQHVVGGQVQPPNVDALRGASTVLWYVDGAQTTLEGLFDPRLTTYNALAGYVRVGGNLVLAGQKALSHILDDPYPIEIDPADTSQAVVFVRDYLHVGYADCSGGNCNKDSPWSYGYCYHGAEPAPGFEDWFEPMYIDSVGPGGYPEPGKWPMYTSSLPQYSRCGLPFIEKLQAYQGTAMEIMTIHAFLNANYDGQPIAILYLSGDNHGNACYIGTMLYYQQYDHVKPFMDKVLALFGEEKLTK